MKLKLSSKLNDIQISEIRQIVNLAKKDTINLGIGQLPFDPPAALIEAGIKSFQSGQLKYSPNAGLPELRELIALEHQSQTGKPTTFENVIITVGVESALYITFATFLDPDDEVLIPEIYFSVYDTIPKMLGAKIKTFKLNADFSIDIQDLKKKITKKTKLIVINSPCNPTGKIVSLAEQQSLADIVAHHPLLHLVSDEVYAELYFTPKKPVSLAKFSDKVIVLNGISKRASATGLRIGWIIAPKPITQELVKIQQYSVTCAAITSQKAAMPVLRGECDQDTARYREVLAEHRALALTLLADIPKIKVVAPEGAFYCFVDISAYGKSKEIAYRILADKNVLTIPGIAFGKKGDRYLRISFAADLTAIKQGLKALKAFFVTE